MNKKNIKTLLPLLIICLTAIAVFIIIKNPPEAKKRKHKQTKAIQVETISLKTKDFDIILNSYGVVEPSVTTQLISQVSGKIIYVNEKFKNGAYIKKNELLLKIEDDDYLANVKIEKSKYILAQQALVEEEAKSAQAKRDWQKFNKNAKFNELVLRIPQLKSAKANLLAALAQLEKAQLQLKRTKIFSPYDARVIKKKISIAQVISNNANLASVFETKSLEIRLPLRNNELEFIDLRNSNEVELYSNISKKTYKGYISRSESSIDVNTKQLYLIAHMNDINNELHIGEYLKAQIKVKKILNALVIPNTAIYENSYVYLENNNSILKKEIKIKWQNENISILLNDLDIENNLVTTVLSTVSSGTKVKVINKNTKSFVSKKNKKKRFKKNEKNESKIL